MNDEKLVRISKFFSKHLRHAPEELGLMLASVVFMMDAARMCADNHRFCVSVNGVNTRRKSW